MEENSGGKKKTTPSIPANYISILQLKERWFNEKERKRKEEEEEERRQKEQVEEEKKTDEEDLMKADEENRLNRPRRKRYGGKNKSMNGGGARFVEKEVTAEIGSERGKDTPERLSEKNKAVIGCGFVSIVPSKSIVAENVTPVKDEIRVYRKKGERARIVKKGKLEVTAAIGSEKGKDASEGFPKKNKAVVGCGFVSIAPSESIMAENVTPVKNEIRVYRKKGEKAVRGIKSVVTDETMAMKTKFENLSIKRGETTNLKAQTKPRYSNCASKMVWVKKEQNERAGDGFGIGSGVKPLNA